MDPPPFQTFEGETGTTTYASGPGMKSSDELDDVEKMYRRIANRLVFDFEKVACCPCQPTGLDEGVQSQLPTELAKAGVTFHQWQKWVEDLEKVQRKSPTISGCLCMFCFPGLFLQSILCAFLCPISANHPLKCLPCFYGDWYVGLKDWMDKVNMELNRLGMHAKLVTYKPYHKAPKSRNYGDRVAGKNHDYEMSFLIIALTHKESLKLQEESWDHGVNDRFTTGIGRIL